MTNKRIRFCGEEYVLVGGAIATPDQLENFTESFAHLCDDGRILRHGKVIGHREDIEILGDSDVNATLDGLLRNGLNPEAWPRLFRREGNEDG